MRRGGGIPSRFYARYSFVFGRFVNRPYGVINNSAFCTLHSALSFLINFSNTSLSVRSSVRGEMVV